LLITGLGIVAISTRIISSALTKSVEKNEEIMNPA
jgi:hypothetical protein